MKKLKNNFINSSLLIYIIFWINLSIAFGYEIDTTRSIHEKKYYEVVFDDFIYAAQDFIYIGNKTLDFDYNDMYATAGLFGVTAISMTLDKGIRNNSINTQKDFLDGFFEQMNRLGSSGNATALTAGIYLSGLLLEDNELRITGRLMFEGLFTSGMITSGLKVFFGRSRPYLEEGNM
jgi:hypothetical protein